MVIFNTAMHSLNVSLLKAHKGVEGSTIILLPKSRKEVPETVKDEPDLARLLKKGVVVVVKEGAAKKEDEKKSKKEGK